MNMNLNYRKMYNVGQIVGALFLAGCSPQYGSLSMNQSCRSSNSSFSFVEDNTVFKVKYDPRKKREIPRFCSRPESKLKVFVKSRQQARSPRDPKRKMGAGSQGFYLNRDNEVDFWVIYH